ncbi:MAG TPA: hypothetical protein VGR48_18475 [Terriglobales bacterium]|nr:hypothetical protein [Terriglobales bacterium]
MSVKNAKHSGKSSRRHKKQEQPEVQSVVQAQAEVSVPEASRDFERQLQDHFAAEARKKVEEAAENIFGSLLARHGWIRNERGQVEYVGGDGI